MTAYKFKGWENIDTSEVTTSEVEASYLAVQSKIREIENAYGQKTAAVKRPVFRRVIAWAAAAAALIMIPVGIHLYDSRKDAGMTAGLERSTVNGEITEVVLPDGSKATLNAGSVLKYPESFGRKRIVELEGEALFEVTSSKSHPFTVRTQDISVTAHGTTFNVNAYPDGHSASTTLCSGAVSVERTSGRQKAELKPGDTYTLDRSSGAVAVTQTSPEDLTAWKNGHLCIISQPVAEAFRMVARKFDVSIHLTTDAYDKAVLTAKFINGESLEEVLTAVCHLVPGMVYTIEGKDIYIR